MSTEPSANPVPKDVLVSIQHYLDRVNGFFSAREIAYSASCQVTAGTSVDDEIWAAGAQPNATMFVGSAVKSFILAEYLQQFGVPRHQLSVIDDNIRSISGSVFGFEGSDPEVDLDGKTLTRNVLEAMISHSDNTATDSILADVGADKVRELIADVGLSSVEIPDSTRRLFAYLASGQNVDVDWETLLGYVNDPPNPQNAINDTQSMLASAADMVRWYQTALLEPGFFELPEELTEFKRVSSMADALSRVVPDNLASYGKGGSITWNNFSCISVSGQMIMPTHDTVLPWVPLTFSFALNWEHDNPKLFGLVAGLFVDTMKHVLQASLDAFYWTVTNFTLTLGNDNLTGTSGHDDFAGPAGGTDALYGLGSDDAFHIRAGQAGLIDGGSGYDTVYAIDAQLDSGLAFKAVEVLNAAEPSLSATVDQLRYFSSIVPGAGGTDFDLFLRGAGGVLDLSRRFDSPVRLHVDAALADSHVVLTGTSQDDSLVGSSFNDMLTGGLGDDTLDGGPGFNTVGYADAGRAVAVNLGLGVAVGQGRDTLANFQRVIGSAYDDGLTGDANANTIFGGDGDDWLRGLAGDDRLLGDGGADQLTGGLGRDMLTGGLGDDTLDGDSGFNTVAYADAGRAVAVNLGLGVAVGQGRDTLANFQRVIGSAYDDGLTGDANANTLSGGDGDDRLRGLAGDDRLLGDDGADQLTGGLGGDKTAGGAGPDLFVFNRISESTVAGGWDRIMDFDGAAGDLIDLRAIDAEAKVDGNQPFTFIGSNPFSHTAGELRYFVSGAAGLLFGDVNGDAVADFAVQFDNHPMLTAANILL